jgi:hypothetical protein
MQNPWLTLPLSPPYILAEDDLAISAYNRIFHDKGKKEQAIYREAFPEPYCGNPQAPILLLNLDPGYSERIHLFG